MRASARRAKRLDARWVVWHLSQFVDLRFVLAMAVVAALPSCATSARAPHEAASKLAASRWAREIETTTVPATCADAQTIELRQTLADGTREERLFECAGESVRVTLSRERTNETESFFMTVASFYAFYTHAVTNAAALRCPRLETFARPLPREALVLRVGRRGGQAVVCDLTLASSPLWGPWIAAAVRATSNATSRYPTFEPGSFPTGWYAVERCEGTPPWDVGFAYRFTRAGWSELNHDETHVFRTDARFGEEGDGFAATYDAGSVIYAVDQPELGFVVGMLEEVTGKAQLRRDREALQLRRTWSSPHSNRHDVSCRLVPATRAQAERFDRAVLSAEDPAHCVRAAECCRALGGISACHEEEPWRTHCRTWVPICEKAPGTDPQRCRSWLGELPFDLNGQPSSSLPTVCR
jgi:hypothetical protein